MIALSDTSTHPGTVMVMHFNAGLTIATVERSRRSQNSACAAPHDSDFLRFDYAYVFTFANLRHQVFA